MGCYLKLKVVITVGKLMFQSLWADGIGRHEESRPSPSSLLPCELSVYVKENPDKENIVEYAVIRS